MMSLVSTPVMSAENKRVQALSQGDHEEDDDDNDASSVTLASVNVEVIRQNETGSDSNPGTTEGSLSAGIAAIKLQESTDDVARKTTQDVDLKYVVVSARLEPKNGCLKTCGKVEVLKYTSCSSEDHLDHVDTVPLFRIPLKLETDNATPSAHDDDDDSEVQQNIIDNDERPRNDAVITKNAEITEEQIAAGLETMTRKENDVEEKSLQPPNNYTTTSRGPVNGLPTSSQKDGQWKYMRVSPDNTDADLQTHPANWPGIANDSQQVTGLHAGYPGRQFDHAPYVARPTVMNFYSTMPTHFPPVMPGSTAPRLDCRFHNGFDFQRNTQYQLIPHVQNFVPQLSVSRAFVQEQLGYQPTFRHKPVAYPPVAAAESTVTQSSPGEPMAQLTVDDVIRETGDGCYFDSSPVSTHTIDTDKTSGYRASLSPYFYHQQIPGWNAMSSMCASERRVESPPSPSRQFVADSPASSIGYHAQMQTSPAASSDISACASSVSSNGHTAANSYGDNSADMTRSSSGDSCCGSACLAMTTDDGSIELSPGSLVAFHSPADQSVYESHTQQDLCDGVGLISQWPASVNNISAFVNSVHSTSATLPTHGEYVRL